MNDNTLLTGYRPEKLEHHVVLTTDDLTELSGLFEIGLSWIETDIKGTTTISKSKSKVTDLGIKKLSHTYISVDKSGLRFNSKKEILDIVERYTMEGVNNLYVVRAVFSFKDGEMFEFHRAVMHSDIRKDRNFPSTRLNTLAMKVGLYQSCEKLQQRFGKFLLPTACIMKEVVNPKSSRFCLFVM